VLCVLNIGWQDLTNDLFKPVVDVFRKNLRDAIDGADDGPRFQVWFMHFVNAVQLGDLCLAQMVFPRWLV
jgi:hypothetical protein